MKKRPSTLAAIAELLLAISIGVAVLAVARGWFTKSVAGERTQQPPATQRQSSRSSPVSVRIEAAGNRPRATALTGSPMLERTFASQQGWAL